MKRSLKSFLNKSFSPKTPIFIKMIDCTPARFDNGYTWAGGYNFNKDEVWIVTSVKNLYEEYQLLVLNCQSVTNALNVNQFRLIYDFEVEIITGNKRKQLLKEYEETKFKFMEKILVKNPTIGSDPEIFIEDENKEVVPAFNFLGSKKEPNKISDCTEMYWDGFQAEFTTQANTCLEYHCDSIQRCLKALHQKTIKHNPKAKLSFRTVMDIKPELLTSSKDEHVQFGCMPSMNAYNMSGSGANGRQVPFRPAGGHLHLGFTPDFGIKKKDYVPIVKGLDAIIGVACVSLFARFDDPRRRELYGLAGEYRTPPHGLEYRVLSNAWLIHPLIANMVIDIARRIPSFVMNGFMKHWNASEEEVIKCINTCDVEMSREILKRNKKIFLRLLEIIYLKEDLSQAIFKVFMNGLESIVKDPTDIVGNWNLEREWHSQNSNYDKAVRHTIRKILSGEKVA